MKKLKLDVDALVVDSFTTRGSAALVGTVAGQEITQNCGGTAYCTLGSSCNGSCYASCGDPNCGTYYCTGDSCNQTCGGDCSNSCDASCYQSCFTCDTCADTCQTCYGVPTCGPDACA